MRGLLWFVLLVIQNVGFAVEAPPPTPVVEAPKPLAWYDKISLRGYSQIRYNGLLQTNPSLTCEQCDKSWGGDGGFFVRRARLILSGDVHERVYIYIQPDLASTPTGSPGHFAQLRDLYADISLDSRKEYRLRIGQSKVPFGFENLQSSSNRLPLDRNDSLNSAVSNERDLGVFFYWAPLEIRRRFKSLIESGLKGTGDYGVLGLGVYAGQTANQPEANGNRHVVGRLTYPFELPGGQFLEASIQGYVGKFSLLKKTTGVTTDALYDDRRAALSLVWYPQPFGVQVEYNFGHGPQFDPGLSRVSLAALEGAYIQIMYQAKLGKQVFFPFARVSYYRGGKKHELDARLYDIREFDIGLEWQPISALELVAQYVVSSRRFEDGANPDNRQTGRLLRLQAQVNY